MHRTYDWWKAHNPADDELGPEPEEDEGEPEPREDEWEHWAGPFVNRAVAEQCALNLNLHSFAREWYLFEVFPDEATDGKWVIKRTWK